METHFETSSCLVFKISRSSLLKINPMGNDTYPIDTTYGTVGDVPYSE